MQLIRYCNELKCSEMNFDLWLSTQYGFSYLQHKHGFLTNFSNIWIFSVTNKYTGLIKIHTTRRNSCTSSVPLPCYGNKMILLKRYKCVTIKTCSFTFTDCFKRVFIVQYNTQIQPREKFVNRFEIEVY